jgi:outer membrane immunogenic protein
MKAPLLGSVAVSLLAVSAFGADLEPDTHFKSPPAIRFTWTSCYAGGHVGGGMARNDVTDPIQLVQDSFLGPGTTIGATTVGVTPSGVVAGAQVGCDYQFDSRFVVGVEGAVSGSTMQAHSTVGLPAGMPGDQAVVSAKTDFLPSVTARAGYAMDRVLLYAKGGVAWAGDQYDVTGSFTGTPFAFQGLDMRTGFTTGGGVAWAFAQQWSINVEYDYYQFGHGVVLMTDSTNVLSGPVDTVQHIQVIKVGLNFHVWASDW